MIVTRTMYSIVLCPWRRRNMFFLSKSNCCPNYVILSEAELSSESHPVEILRRSAPQDDEVRFMSRMTMHAGESLIYLDTHEK